MAKEHFCGIDIGGTKISVIVTDSAGKVLGRAKKKSRAERGFAQVISRAIECVQSACEEAGISVSDLKAGGVGAPSPILPDGTAVAAPNMGWKDEPLGASLSEGLGIEIFAENDCNIGTFGEYAVRKAEGKLADNQNLIGLFMGTGLGGGMMIQGRLVTGLNSLAAEVGHMTVSLDGRKCGCGKRGCLEAYASKKGMGYAFKKAILLEKEKSLLPELLEEGTLDNVKSSILKKAWDKDDDLTRRTLLRAAEVLGIGVGNLITLLGPKVVVLGGGVLEALGKELLPVIRASAKSATFPPAAFTQANVELASLGDDAVARGAMEFAKARVSAQ